MEAAALAFLVASTISGSMLVTSHHVCYIGNDYSREAPCDKRWVSYQDPCKCTAVRLGGINTQPPNYQDGAPYYLDKLVLGEDPGEIQALFKCSGPLGMENGGIPDSALMASSNDIPNYPEVKSRLNSNSAWCTFKEQPWIRVELQRPTTVTGIITQGRHKSGVWVKSYRVEYSDDGYSWTCVADEERGLPLEFQANTDHSTPVTVYFPVAVETRFVKILPITTSKEGSFCLRFEVLGFNGYN